jgi:methyltransferase-like protein 6
MVNQLDSLLREDQDNEQEYRQLIESDQRRVKPFFAQKFISTAGKQWDIFYKNNQTNFFKDRHWCKSEFPELQTSGTRIFEIGCGVGNFLLPQLERNSTCFMYGCDFSPRAIQMLKDCPKYDPQRSLAFVCDMSVDYDRSDDSETGLLSYIQPQSIDIITCIFMMSALTPSQMPACVRNIKKVR